MKTTFLQTVAFALVPLWVSCTSVGRSEEGSGTVKTLPVYEISTQNLEIHEDYVADINAMQNVEIRSRVKGYLDKIYVDEGKPVKKGQLLFSISDDIYQSELKKAKANTQIAIAEAKAAEMTKFNMKKLVEKGVVNKTEYELAKAKHESLLAKVEEAKANQQTAEINLSHALIKAPFDGIIDRFPLKMGSVIDEGALLTSISDVSYMHVYFKISEIEYLNFMKQKAYLDSSEVRLILADGSVHKESGKIETIEGDFEVGTGTIAIRAKFPNSNKLLKHGASGKVRLTNKLEDVIVIPQKATFDIQDKTFVYLVGKDNKVELKSVNPIKRLKDYYIIDDRSLVGRMIVYEGIQGVQPDEVIMLQKISDLDIANDLAL